MRRHSRQLRRAQLLVVAALVFGTALAGCSPQEDPNMRSSTTTTRPQATIPALDAIAPAEVQTATFALG